MIDSKAFKIKICHLDPIKLEHIQIGFMKIRVSNPKMGFPISIMSTFRSRDRTQSGS
jgi:hypothetical protein